MNIKVGRKEYTITCNKCYKRVTNIINASDKGDKIVKVDGRAFKVDEDTYRELAEMECYHDN